VRGHHVVLDKNSRLGARVSVSRGHRASDRKLSAKGAIGRKSSAEIVALNRLRRFFRDGLSRTVALGLHPTARKVRAPKRDATHVQSVASADYCNGSPCHCSGCYGVSHPSDSHILLIATAVAARNPSSWRLSAPSRPNRRTTMNRWSAFVRWRSFLAARDFASHSHRCKILCPERNTGPRIIGHWGTLPMSTRGLVRAWIRTRLRLRARLRSAIRKPSPPRKTPAQQQNGRPRLHKAARLQKPRRPDERLQNVIAQRAGSQCESSSHYR